MSVTGQVSEYRNLTPLFLELADGSASEPRRRLLRDRLVTGYLPLAEHIARRFRNRGQPDDDLAQVAMVGLINAVDRFDPDRGTEFLAFAVPTITGEVRRYFRDFTWSVRVPRRLKELHAAIGAASAALGQELGHLPRPSDLAAKLDLPIEEVHEGLRAGRAYHSESLGETENEGGRAGREAVVDQSLLSVEDRQTLYPALATLPAREASIVVMRFFGNMTQSQIGERLGISQMHVSRLLAASLRALRTVLDGAVTP